MIAMATQMLFLFVNISTAQDSEISWKLLYFPILN
jgi:hypothetical protein